MKIVNYIERHNFCLKDLLTKSNRTEIQTYEVEERTFGTPCKWLAVVQAIFFNEETYTAILLILNDDKNTTQSPWLKIYSSKNLFTSFHLNNHTESGWRILSSCSFCLILIFSRLLRTATLGTSFRPLSNCIIIVLKIHTFAF